MPSSFRTVALSLACATGAMATVLGSPYSSYTAGNPQSFVEKQFSQYFYDGYNVLHHYGGNGPYSDRESYGIDRNPPQGCAVDQVFMIMRHGERYPDPSTYHEFVNSLDKIYAANITKWQGDLAFLNDWTFWITDPAMCAQETWTGPYAGLITGYSRGVNYRDRYGHLYDGESVLPIFSSGYERVIETARKFGEGFLGYNYSTLGAVNIIPESDSQGANSLTPTCVNDNDTAVCDSLTGLLPQFYVAADRLNGQNPGLNLNASDVFYLMQMAAFELNARPISKWISAFTLDEWVSFGYTQDLYYYYCNGPGDANMKAVGQVWVNATLTLMNQGPSEGTMYWSFTHDTNITPIVFALGLLIPDQDLTVDTIAFGNPYSTSNIVPMGGHVTLERLTCNATAVTSAGTYVRAVINEAVVPFPTCKDGPGYSCALSNYTSYVNSLPDFINTCGIPSNVSHTLDFFWDYNTSTQYDYQVGPISYQLGTTDT